MFEVAVKWRVAGMTLGHSKASIPLLIVLHAIYKAISPNAERFPLVSAMVEDQMQRVTVLPGFKPVTIFDSRGVTLRILPGAEADAAK